MENVGYKKEYRIRTVIPGKKHYTVVIPAEVVQRQADQRGITVKEFLDQFRAIAEYDNFDGVHYTFKPVDEG